MIDKKKLKAEIMKKVSLAVNYMEDGAFATARQRLLEAADLLPVSANGMRMIESERRSNERRSKLVGMLMEAKIFEAGRRAGMEEGAKIAEEWKAGWMATNHGSSVASAIRERLK